MGENIVCVNPQIFLSGYGVRPHVSGEFAGESGTFWIRSPEWIFLNPIWIRNRVDAKSGYCFIRMTWQDRAHFLTVKSILKMALLPLFPWGVLSTRVNPDTFRICVDGQIRFEYATCEWKYFWIRKEKVADSINETAYSLFDLVPVFYGL